MSIVNQRYQHAVGQGFFHSGLLRDEDGRLRLSYVYDCGSMQAHAVARERCIDHHIDNVGRRSRLDILFLSHVHADHVNGLSRLLDSASGLKVDTIVLPLVNVSERLIALGRSAVEDRAAAQDGFYRDFIIDPVEALGRFGPRRIFLVRPSGPEGGAPDGGERPLDPPDGPYVGRTALVDEESRWKLAGRGSMCWHDGSERQGDSQTHVFEIEDSIAFALWAGSASQPAHWLLAPFVDPGIVAGRATFLRELARRCHVPRRHLEVWLADRNNLRDLVLNGVERLAGAYAEVARDLNISSLCLYSGPARDASGEPRGLAGRFGLVSINGGKGIAWLATGDAALKQRERRAAFVAHYRNLLEEVATLTLPHHGSDHNFDPDLLAQVRPQLCVAAAERYSNWKHPGPLTVQSVCSLPAVMHVVTSDPRSSGWETAMLG